MTGREFPIVNPAVLIEHHRRKFHFGFVEWFAREDGRYTETVILRRNNPFAFHGTLGLAWLAVIYFLRTVGLEMLARVNSQPAPVVDSMGMLDAFVYFAVGMVAVWILTGIVVRLRPKEGETRRRKDSLPWPEEYRDALTEEELADMAAFSKGGPS